MLETLKDLLKRGVVELIKWFLVIMVVTFGFQLYQWINFDSLKDKFSSDSELIVGKWKIVGGSVYSEGETEEVKIAQSGDNSIFGTLDKPVYYLFTTENELVILQSKKDKFILPYKIEDNKIITDDSQADIEIIKLNSRELIFKREVIWKPFEGFEHKLGKWVYTLKAVKVK